MADVYPFKFVEIKKKYPFSHRGGGRGGRGKGDRGRGRGRGGHGGRKFDEREKDFMTATEPGRWVSNDY